MTDKKARYINPYTDFGFKRLFGTEANKDLLRDFLNCLMPPKHQISDIIFRNVEQYGETSGDRKAFYDIHCQSVMGDRFIVEMQKAKVKYFKERSLFYTTFPIREQVVKGDWDYNLLPIYYIAILDFEYDEQEEIRKFDRNVKLRDEDGFVFYDKLGFHFLQMPFFTKTEQELTTHYDKWCFFLKHLEDFDNIPQILQEPVFEKAFHTAEFAAMNPIEQEEYIKSKLVYIEHREVLNTAIEEATEKGIEQEKIEAAERGIKAGFSNDTIKIMTELSDEQIDNIRKR